MRTSGNSPDDGLGLEVDASEGDYLVYQPVVPRHLLLLLLLGHPGLLGHGALKYGTLKYSYVDINIYYTVGYLYFNKYI